MKKLLLISILSLAGGALATGPIQPTIDIDTIEGRMQPPAPPSPPIIDPPTFVKPIDQPIINPTTSPQINLHIEPMPAPNPDGLEAPPNIMNIPQISSENIFYKKNMKPIYNKLLENNIMAIEIDLFKINNICKESKDLDNCILENAKKNHKYNEDSIFCNNQIFIDYSDKSAEKKTNQYIC